MADQDRNINIDISGDTANMATDYGLSGVSLGDAHVSLSKLVWGDSSEGNRVTLSQGLPVQFAGQTGPITITGKIGGDIASSVRTSNFLHTDHSGPVGYNQWGDGHAVQYIAVAGNTSGEGPSSFIGVTGTVQGLVDGTPLTITGSVYLQNTMAGGATTEGIVVQGGRAGVTATVAGEVFSADGFGVPIAVTAGRRMSSLTDSITVTGSVQADGGRELSQATDSVRVFGHDGLNSVRSVLMPDPTTGTTAGWTSGYPGGPVDTLQVALMNAGQGITFSVALQSVTAVQNHGDTALRIQGITADSPGDPVIVRGENAGALEIYSTSGLNTNVTNTVAINDTNIVKALEASDKPINSNLDAIKENTDSLPIIRQDLTRGTVSAKISEIIKPADLRSGSVTVTGSAKTLHSNSQIKTGVTLKSSVNNTGNILVGNRSLGNNNSNGYPLEPGESIFLEINNLNRIFVKAESSGNTIQTQTLFYLGS